MSEKILVTGTSGFIGYHVALKLLERGDNVIGYDNENNYYDCNLKILRRKQLEVFSNFKSYKANIEDLEIIKNVFEYDKPDKVIHLAAQAGVRFSLKNPFCYVQSNIVGFHNIIELSRQFKIKNFIYASSSSVYGKNTKIPFSVKDKTDTPISIYAATKKSNELIAHTYSHLFKLPTTGLRFFTVYGPYWRPDMAIPIFTDSIMKGIPINIFNGGKMKRDFTYVDDVTEAILKASDTINQYEVFNIGNQNSVELEYVIGLIEKNLEKKAIKNYTDIQPGDVLETWADIDDTKKKLYWEPRIQIEDGIEKTIDWYKKYNHLSS